MAVYTCCLVGVQLARRLKLRSRRDATVHEPRTATQGCILKQKSAEDSLLQGALPKEFCSDSKGRMRPLASQHYLEITPMDALIILRRSQYTSKLKDDTSFK